MFDNITEREKSLLKTKLPCLFRHPSWFAPMVIFLKELRKDA